MDVNVKLMIKLLEEEADSFAERAEMFYKKRPELMKLVEEFYRAYRALAERYDHATGALRQAHKTIAEAFPNQMPLALIDDSFPSYPVIEEPDTPETQPQIRVFVETDDLKTDAFSQSACFISSRKNGAHSEKNDVFSRRGLKQLTEMFVSGEESKSPRFPEINGLHFKEKMDKVCKQKVNEVHWHSRNSKVRSTEGGIEKPSDVQDEVFPLSVSNLNQKVQIGDKNLEKSESEIHRIQEYTLRLGADKGASFAQNCDSMNTHTDLETAEISQLETEKQALLMQLNAFADQRYYQQQELLQKQEEVQLLKNTVKKEHMRRQLVSKDLALAEVQQKLKVAEYEKTDLCRDLKDTNMKFDQTMHVREKLEKSISELVESILLKDNIIARTSEINQTLRAEINCFGRELAVLRTNKEHLILELEHDNKSYEEEIRRLYGEIYMSSTYMGIYEEKIFELMVEHNSFEIAAMIQKRMLEEQITRNIAHVDQFRQTLDSIKSENEKLKAQLNGYLPSVVSLQSSINSMEHYIFSLAKLHGLCNELMHDSSLFALRHEKGHELFPQDPRINETDGILCIQKLQFKVEELENFLMECWGTLMQESANANANAKSSVMKVDTEARRPANDLVEDWCTTMEHKKETQDAGQHLNVQSGLTESCKSTYGLLLKDIELDHASYDSETCRVHNLENDNQIPAFWETTERDLFILKMFKAPSITEDIDCNQTWPFKEEKIHHTPEVVAEKEVDVKKLEMDRKKNSHIDWNQKILECLASDAHRLSTLEKNMQQLKRMLENLENTGSSANTKHDSVRWQLREAEQAISQLFDINRVLIEKAENCYTSYCSNIGEEEEVMNHKRRRVSDRARRGSEKIGRLELEMQRIQYIIMNLGDKHRNRTRAKQKRPNVILRDYLYGKRESNKQKKTPFCACVQTKQGNY